MFVVGLTGGIGSGKTRVSDAFYKLGITIVDTDIIARQVVEPGSACLKAIHAHFGDSILLNDGSLDRKALRSIIFSSAVEKNWVESLLHPSIRDITRRAISNVKSEYCILVSPLLLESPDAALCRRILVVDTPVELQISRTVARDKVSSDQVKKTISLQIERDKRLKKADDVIDNSGAWADTETQILPLHKKYLQYAKKFQADNTTL